MCGYSLSVHMIGVITMANNKLFVGGASSVLFKKQNCSHSKEHVVFNVMVFIFTSTLKFVIFSYTQKYSNSPCVCYIRVFVSL